MAAKNHRKTRTPLSPERIAGEALTLVDEAGLEGFSFRTLAKRLGCEAMSLYHYFPSKAHLFDAMVEIYYRDFTFLPDDAPWRDRLRMICMEFRAAALRHPAFFQFVSIYRMNSRAGLKLLDRILEAFEATGLDAEARARHFRVISYYLTGAALDEALGYAKGPSAAEPVPSDEARRDFPAIMAVGPFFSPIHHDKTFEQGLEALLAEVDKDVALLPR
ncbi:MAG: TetR/AcrR family transcriptional regulator C-terminal domain-containing protein [Alphaproteobacteria bacterium]|nr:TetR/AcrR family transcriptional regulator C-terminal domain-containing protein [Alphaproteobacteria bacterium]